MSTDDIKCIDEMSHEEQVAVLEHIKKNHSSHIIKFLLHRKICQIDDEKVFKFLYNEILEAFPPIPLGSVMLEAYGVKFYISFRPCKKDHDLAAFVQILPRSIHKKFVTIVGSLLCRVKIDYEEFLEEYEYLKDILNEKLPDGKKSLLIHVENDNTTIYIDEDDDIRIGVFVEREDMLDQIEDDLTKDLRIDKKMEKTFEYHMINYLSYRIIEWKYYMNSMSMYGLMFRAIQYSICTKERILKEEEMEGKKVYKEVDKEECEKVSEEECEKVGESASKEECEKVSEEECEKVGEEECEKVGEEE